MYARVAAFENPRFGDPSLVQELTSRVRETAPQWREELQNAQGHVMLVDRENGRGLGITFFGSEEDIRRAEPVFDRMGDEVPEEARGKRTSVDAYEVVLNELREGGEAARVSRLEGDPSQLEESIRRSKEDILPRARELPGFAGALSMVDRSRGRTLLVTFWQSEEAMRSSEEAADRLRQEAADIGRGRIAGVERYRVAFADRIAEVGASR